MTDREKLIQLLDTNCGYVDEVKAEVLADHLISNGVTVQEWVSLSEQKPNRDDRVIVFFEGMKDTPAAIQIMYGWCICGSASHWMPLPKPPKGE